MRDLKAMGFRFSLVLADSLWGERSGFVNVLYELKLLQWRFAAIMQSGCRANKRFGIIDGENLRVFSDGKTELRYIREIIFGKRRAQQFWELTTDPETCQRMERGM